MTERGAGWEHPNAQLALCTQPIQFELSGLSWSLLKTCVLPMTGGHDKAAAPN